MSEAGAGESVRRTLSRAARRLRVRRLLDELPPALCAGLAGAALSLLLTAGPLRNGLALVTPLLAAAWLGWRTLRPVSAAHAAAWLDRRAALADSLTTACWFLDQPRDDAWVRHQRELADAASRALDLRQLVPLRVAPAPALLAAALALVVILGWRGGPPAPPGSASARVADDEGAPRSQADESPAESEAEAGRDSVPWALPAPADLEALAEELRAGLSEEARERLRELARQAEARRPPDADASGEGSAENASGESLSGEELAAALAEASEAMARGDQDAAAQALEEAAEAAGAQRQQQQMQMQKPDDPGQQRQASAQDEAAAQAPADAGVRWSLDALDPQSLGAEEAQQAARGDAAGPPSGGEPQEGEATRLDVELEREALSSESARETEPTEITEEASREQSARTGYGSGTAAGRYDSARPLETAEVPWSARERVRRYLLALTREETQR